MWTDCHAHPADERFAALWPDAWRLAQETGVRRVLSGGVDPEDWASQEKMASEDARIIPCYGLHPYFVSAADDAECEQAFTMLMTQAKRSPLLGEVGIDRRREYVHALARQQAYMEKQLDLAIQLNKVPVYHIVHAHNEVQQALKARAGRLRGGIVHSFSGNEQIARFYVDHGCLISIGPRLLHPQNEALRAVVRALPLDRLLVESDAPDGRRTGPGDLGEPAVVAEIAAELCRVKGVEQEAYAEVLERNVQRLLGLGSVT